MNFVFLSCAFVNRAWGIQTPINQDKKATLKSAFIKNKTGFTLVEMMIIIGILAILSGIAGLSYFSMRPTLMLNGATRQIQGDLMAARMKAVSENNDYKIFFLNDHVYTILDDDDNDGTADAGEWSNSKDIQNEYPDVTFSSTGDPVLSPKGTADSLITITLTNINGTSKSVSIAISGRVKIN